MTWNLHKYEGEKSFDSNVSDSNNDEMEHDSEHNFDSEEMDHNEKHSDGSNVDMDDKNADLPPVSHDVCQNNVHSKN